MDTLHEQKRSAKVARKRTDASGRATIRAVPASDAVAAARRACRRRRKRAFRAERAVGAAIDRVVGAAIAVCVTAQVGDGSRNKTSPTHDVEPLLLV